MQTFSNLDMISSDLLTFTIVLVLSENKILVANDDYSIKIIDLT